MDRLADAVMLSARNIREQQRQALESLSSTESRAKVVGVGAGGDETIAIDQHFEQIVIQGFESLARQMGVQFDLLTEEAGHLRVGSGPNAGWLFVDPVDGSLNAKRGWPSFCFSVAYSPTLSIDDVWAGLVHDFGSDETFEAVRGRGATLNGRPIQASREIRREIALIESAAPQRVASVAPLFSSYSRLRILGAASLTLCYLAAGRVDAVYMTRPRRIVDVAAGALIAQESGSTVRIHSTQHNDALVANPLGDHYQVIAATSVAEAMRLATWS